MVESCLKIYLSTKFIVFLKKNNINIFYLLQILLHIDTKMKISFTDKILESDHPVFIISNKASKINSSIHNVNSEITKILKEFIKNNKNSSSTFKTLSYTKKGKIFYFTIARCKTKLIHPRNLNFLVGFFHI